MEYVLQKSLVVKNKIDIRRNIAEILECNNEDDTKSAQEEIANSILGKENITFNTISRLNIHN